MTAAVMTSAATDAPRAAADLPGDAVLPALAAQKCLPNDASWILQASRMTGSALCACA